MSKDVEPNQWDQKYMEYLQPKFRGFNWLTATQVGELAGLHHHVTMAIENKEWASAAHGFGMLCAAVPALAGVAGIIVGYLGSSFLLFIVLAILVIVLFSLSAFIVAQTEKYAFRLYPHLNSQAEREEILEQMTPAEIEKMKQWAKEGNHDGFFKYLPNYKEGLRQEVESYRSLIPGLTWKEAVAISGIEENRIVGLTKEPK